MNGRQPHVTLSSSALSHRMAWSILLLVAALVATALAPSTAGAEEAGFSDSADAKGHRQAVDSLAELGYFEGTECDTDMFCPRDPIKRWVMAVWLVRALGHKAPATDTSQFTDVEEDEWWSPYAERLAKLKITEGCKTEPLRYCPDRAVNRAQMATFLVRALDLDEAPSAGFVDTEGSDHAANIDAPAAAGITSGCETEPLSYCPNKPVTRAQMATFLHRAIPRSERAILAVLYHATSGPKWHARTKWLSNTPISEWYGISVDRNGHVRSLDLRQNGMSGPIPAVLGDLAELDDLFLDRNELVGPIPPELGRLSRLGQLNLSSNKLSGPIPPELGRLSLISLYLGDNDLTGPIPTELGEITGLRYLGLQRNELSGPIPAELGELLDLVHLFLSDNELSGSIPAQIFDLPTLRVLGLGDNQLSGPIPSGLAKLTTLESLSLSVTGPIPPELASLENLQVLELAENGLTGPIPPEFGTMPNLSTLNLAANRLRGPVPAELGESTSLRALYLLGNDLSGCVPKWAQELDNSDYALWRLPLCD